MPAASKLKDSLSPSRAHGYPVEEEFNNKKKVSATGHRRLLQEEEFCVVDILVKVRVSETQIGVGENPQYLQENINLL